MRRPRTVCGLSFARPGFGFAVAFALLVILTAPARSAEPERSPRRYIPARSLVLYLEYEGLDAHAGAWQATAAHDMLVKTPTGAMLIELFKQWADGPIKGWSLGELGAADVVAFTEYLARNGFVCGFYSSDGGDEGAIVVLKAFGKTDLPRPLAPLRQFLTFFGADEEGAALALRRVRGREVYECRHTTPDSDAKNPLYVDEPPGTMPAPPEAPFLSAWMENDDLILVVGDCGVQATGQKKKGQPAVERDPIAAVLDAIEGKEADVTTHPGFISAVAEGKDLKGFEANGLFFLEEKPGLGSMLTLIEFGAADLLFEMVDEVFIQPLTNLPQPGGKTDVRTTPPAKKDDQLALASTDRPKDRPAPAIVKAGPATEKDEPKAVAVTRPSKAGSAGSLVPSKPATDLARDAVAEPVDDDGEAIPSPEDFELELARKLGLDGVKRIVVRWGFQGKALLSDVRVEAPAPRQGMSAWFEQPSFRRDRLPAIPPDAIDFVLTSFDPDRFYQKVVETVEEFGDESTKELPALLEFLLRYQTGLSLREDLLRHVGPTWAIVEMPDRAGHPGPGAPVGRKHPVLVASLDNADAFEKVVDRTAHRIDRSLRAFAESERKKAPKGKEIGTFGMRRLPAPDRGYKVDLPSITSSDGREKSSTLNSRKDKMSSLYVLIGPSAIVVALNLDSGHDVLAAQRPAARPYWKPAGELEKALRGLPEDLTFLAVSDPECCGLPESIAGLPDTVRDIMTGLTLSEDLHNKTCWSLLDLMGLPRPGQSRPRTDRAPTPKVDDLRRCLFPNVLATTVDDRGYRMIHTESVPFAGLTSLIAVDHRWSVQWKGFAWPEVRFKLSVGASRIVGSQ